MTTLRVYERPNERWIIDEIDDQGDPRILVTYAPGEAGLPYVQAYLRGYFQMDRAPR